jgi:hypothetical protein
LVTNHFTNYTFGPDIICSASPYADMIGKWTYDSTNSDLQIGVYKYSGSTNYLFLDPLGASQAFGWVFGTTTNNGEGGDILLGTLLSQNNATPISLCGTPWVFGYGTDYQGSNATVTIEFEAHTNISTTVLTNVAGSFFAWQETLLNPLSYLLNFPHVGPAMSQTNRIPGAVDPRIVNCQTNNLGLLYVAGGSGVMRGVKAMNAASLAGWNDRTNLYLQIFVDGGANQTVVADSNYMVFSAPLSALASCSYPWASETNRSWSEQYVDVSILYTNIAWTNGNFSPTFMVKLKLPCPFTNGIFVRMYDFANKSDASGNFYSVAWYETNSTLANFPFSDWRLHASWATSNAWPGNIPATFLYETNKTGVMLGIWASVDISKDNHWPMEHDWYFLADGVGQPWSDSGGEDLPNNPYEFGQGGNITALTFGTPNWSRTNYAEFYCSFTTEAPFFKHSMVGQIPFNSQGSAIPANILTIYYAKPTP